MVNVQDFGAVGDGQTDDTQAIRDAANQAAPDGEVYFPAGTYLIGSNSRLPLDYPDDGSWNNLTWRGKNTENSIIKLAPGHTEFHSMFNITPSSPIQSLTLRQLTIDGNGSNQNYHPGVSINAQSISGEMLVENCRFQNATTNDINIDNGSLTIRNTSFSRWGVGAYQLEERAGHAITIHTDATVMVENCYFTDGWGGDLDVSTDSAATVTVSKCISEGSKNTFSSFFKINNGPSDVTVENCKVGGYDDMGFKSNPESESIGQLKLDNVIIHDTGRSALDYPAPADLVELNEVSIRNPGDFDFRDGTGIYFDDQPTDFGNSGRISIHYAGSNDDGDAVWIQGGTGSIEEVVYGGTSPPSNWQDSGVIQSTTQGDPLQPDVPSKSEVGPNASGSTSDTGQQIPEDAINVQEFGAVGDGTTDDSDAIQEAIESAEQGDTVYLPAPEQHYAIRGFGRLVEIDGSNVADDITIVGDGRDTLLKFMGGNDNRNFTVMRVSNPIEGFELRDLVIDGGSENVQGDPVAAGSFGINLDSSGSQSYLIKNCIFKNSYGSGAGIRADNCTLENVTAHSNGRHGIGINIGITDNPVVVRNCYTYNNGLNYPTYGLDASEGSIRIYDTVIEENTQGTKVSDGPIDVEYHRVRIQNNDKLAFQSTSSESGQVVFDEVVFGPGNLFVRGSNLDYIVPEGSEIVVTGNESDKAAFQIHEGATLDADGATIWSNDNTGAGLSCFSDTPGNVIGTYSHANNGGGAIDRSENLEIRNRNQEVKKDIDAVPTADEVGFGNISKTTDSDGSNQETQTTESLSSENITVETGSVEKLDSDSKSAVFENKAVGVLETEPDEYRFSGRINEFYVEQPITIRVDGENMGAQEFLQRFMHCIPVITQSSTSETNQTTSTSTASGDVSTNTQGTNYIFTNSNELNAIKEKVDQGEDPWKSAFDQMLNKAENKVNSGNVSYQNSRGSAESARDRIVPLANAYYFTEEDRFARAGIDQIYHFFLNDGTNYEATDPVIPHARIINSITIPGMLYGASILREHPYWDEKIGNQMQEWVETHYQTCLEYSRNEWGSERKPYHWAANRFDYRLVARLAHAAFLDDDQKFDNTVQLFKDLYNAKLDFPDKWYNIPVDAQGRHIDAGRDDGWDYSKYAVGAMVSVAEVARHKGYNLYEWQDSPNDEDIKHDPQKGERSEPLIKRSMKWLNESFNNPESFTSWDHSSTEGGPGPPHVGATKTGVVAYEYTSAFYGDSELGQNIRDVLTEYYGRPNNNRKNEKAITLVHGDLHKLDLSSSTTSTSQTGSGSSLDVFSRYQDISPGASNKEELRGVPLFEHAQDEAAQNTEWLDYNGDGDVTISDVESHAEEAMNEKLFDVETRPSSKASSSHVNLAEFVESYGGSNADAIEEALNNNSRVYIPEGTIEYEGGLWVTNTDEVLLYGPGTLKTTGNVGSYEYMLRFQGVNTLGLYGFKLEGHGPSGENYGGLFIDGGETQASDSLEVRNLEITNVADDQEQDEPHSLSVSGYLNADIVGNYVHDSAAKSLSLRSVEPGVEKQRIVGNHMKNMGEDGIQPGTQTQNDYRPVVVAGNRVDNTRNNYGIRIAGGPGDGSQVLENRGYSVTCVCYKNTFIDGGGANIELKGQGISYTPVIENRLVGNSLNVRQTGSSTGGLLAGNNIEDTGEREGVRLVSGPENVTVRDNRYPGLVINGGSDFWIYNNENYNDFESIDGASNVNRSPR